MLENNIVTMRMIADGQYEFSIWNEKAHTLNPIKKLRYTHIQSVDQ